MVNAAREPLQGDVELDDTWINGTGLRSSPQRPRATFGVARISSSSASPDRNILVC
jgi:hypothetical protein